METTYYTLTAREILVEGAAVQRASGDSARQLVCVRKAAQTAPAAGGKVIDLAAWKADREEEARLEELWYDGVDEALEEEPAAPAPRVRREHKRALNLDLWSSVAVIGVAVILVVRVLTAF